MSLNFAHTQLTEQLHIKHLRHHLPFYRPQKPNKASIVVVFHHLGSNRTMVSARRKLTTLLLLEFFRWATCFKPQLAFSRCQLSPPSSNLRQSSSSSNNENTLFLHHAAIRTRNITTAIEFYSLLGFEVDCRFRAGPARAAWLTTSNSGARLELIEVPSYILNEPQAMRRRAPDLMENQIELGYNHMALDVTQQIRDLQLADLAAWMDRLDQSSVQRFGRNLRVALPPRQQMMGRSVYELAFIYDADGSLVEFLHQQAVVSQSIQSGWDPWDGQGFVGHTGKP